VACCNAVTTPEHCQAWPATDGISYCYIQNRDINIYQVLEHIIGPHLRYTVVFDGMGWDYDVIASLFYIVIEGGVSHVELTSETYLLQGSAEAKDGPCANPLGSESNWNWTRDLMVAFTTEGDGDYIGERLGIRFGTADTDSRYIFIDNVRVNCVWSMCAWDPRPRDGEGGLRGDVTLSWREGTYTQVTGGHRVYFGTSFAEVDAATTSTAGVYRGARDVNNYPVEEDLDSGRTYYWRVDQVNDAYVGSDPPAGPWKGEVWSFSVRYAGDFLYPDGVDFIDYSFFAEHWGEIDYGDVNGVELSGDGRVNWEDFGLFGGWWMESGCGGCGGADFTGEGEVNYLDLYVFAWYWLESEYGDCGGAELTGDGVVGLEDLWEFAGDWLEGV